MRVNMDNDDNNTFNNFNNHHLNDNLPQSPPSPHNHNLRFSIAIAPTKIYRSRSTDSSSSISSSYSNPSILSSSFTSVCSDEDNITIYSKNGHDNNDHDYCFNNDDDETKINDEDYYTSSYYSSTKPIDIPIKAQNKDPTLEPNKGTFGEENEFF